MPAPSPRGRFVWHELMSSDPDAAVGFYGKIVGWKTQTWQGDASYRMWTAGGIPVGGLMALPDEAKRAGSPSHWLSYMGVNDVDAATRQATSLGARVHVPPETVPGAGRFSVLIDPQGASFGLLKPGQESPEAKVGGFSWHELATTDWKRGWDFYRALFGWEKTGEMDMGAQGTYFMFGLGGAPMGGIYNKPLEVPMPNWLPYVSVKSADDAAAGTPRLGGRVLMGPMEVPGGSGDRITVGLDPQGASFAVHWIAPAAKAAARPKPKPKKKAAKAKAKPRAKAKAKRRPKARAKSRR